MGTTQKVSLGNMNEKIYISARHGSWGSSSCNYIINESTR